MKGQGAAAASQRRVLLLLCVCAAVALGVLVFFLLPSSTAGPGGEARRRARKRLQEEVNPSLLVHGEREQVVQGDGPLPGKSRQAVVEEEEEEDRNVIRRAVVVRRRGQPPDLSDPRWVRVPKREPPPKDDHVPPAAAAPPVVPGESSPAAALPFPPPSPPPPPQQHTVDPADLDKLTPLQRGFVLAEKARQDFPSNKIVKHSPGFQRPRNMLELSPAYGEQGAFLTEMARRRERHQQALSEDQGHDPLDFDHHHTPMSLSQNVTPRGGISKADISGRRFSFAGSPAKGRHHHIHFTFDDGPNNYTTPILLDVLKKHNVRATFFFVGGNIDNPEIMQRVVREGHFVGSHTHNHMHMHSASAEAIADSMRKTEQAIQDTTGKQPFVMRVPYGEIDQRAHEVLMERGYLVVGWDIDTNDWQTHKPHEVADVLVRDATTHESGIVLMHEFLHSTLAQDLMIRTLRDAGVEILPLEDFLLPEERDYLYHCYECDILDPDDIYAYTCRLLSGDPNWMPPGPSGKPSKAVASTGGALSSPTSSSATEDTSVTVVPEEQQQAADPVEQAAQRLQEKREAIRSKQLEAHRRRAAEHQASILAPSSPSPPTPPAGDVERHVEQEVPSGTTERVPPPTKKSQRRRGRKASTARE